MTLTELLSIAVPVYFLILCGQGQFALVYLLFALFGTMETEDLQFLLLPLILFSAARMFFTTFKAK